MNLEIKYQVHSGPHTEYYGIHEISINKYDREFNQIINDNIDEYGCHIHYSEHKPHSRTVNLYTTTENYKNMKLNELRKTYVQEIPDLINYMKIYFRDKNLKSLIR